jgi:hypothetical protein
MWYLYTMGILFSYKEEWNFVICRLINGTGEHNFKWSYPGSESQKPCFLSYVEYKHNTNTSNIMKNRSH